LFLIITIIKIPLITKKKQTNGTSALEDFMTAASDAVEKAL